MGTRADFYLGKNESAQWLGSISWDGYREGIPDEILHALNAEAYRAAVLRFIKESEGQLPEHGWPWPWDTSATSDCSYWFFDGETWDALGDPERYYRCQVDWPEDPWGNPEVNNELVQFPDMSATKNVTDGWFIFLGAM